MDSHYRHHVFFCGNQRAPGERVCCADAGANRVRDYAKKRIKALGLAGPGNVRINQAGCLERCEEGPCIVVYPEGVWYAYVDEDDVDEIIDRHLVGGEVVERLRIQGAVGPGCPIESGMTVEEQETSSRV